MKVQTPVRIEYENGIVFEPDKIELGLTEEAQKILKTFDDNIFYIEDHTGTAEEYEAFLWTLIRTMEYGYEHKEFREHPIQFKFYRNKKEKVKWLQFRHFISNCILWIPMVYITNYLSDAWFTEDLVINADRWTSMTTDRVCEWLDDNYTDPYAQEIDGRGYGRSIANTEYFMSQEAVIFLPFMGLSINLEVFIDLAKRMPRYRELLYFKLDTTKQPNELEQDARDAEEEHRQLIINDKEFNPLKFLIHAIKGGQLREVHTIIGCKADDNGNTIAEPININYLTGSLSRIDYYYINGIGGRKAAIYNKEYMGKTGHLLNLVVTMASSVKLSKTVYDCHSANPVPYTIRNEKYLEKMHGRYARYATEDKYWAINGRKDNHLIGQTLFVRSPFTCAAPDGVCPVCYGELYHNNKHLNSPGAYSAVLVMNPVVQAIMEVKHFQTTNSTPIIFQEEFYKFFELSGDEIIIGKDIDFIEDYALIIRKDDLYSVDPDEDMDALFNNKSVKKKRKRSYDDDVADSIEDYNFGDGGDDLSAALELTYATTKFEVAKLDASKTRKKPTEEERYLFHDIDNKELAVHSDFISRMKTGFDDQGGYYYIPLSDISMEEFIFMVEVENEEKSKAAKQVQNLINNKSHEGCDSIETIAQKFLDLLIEARLEATSVHSEMILYKLIRDKDNLLKRPDFRRVIMKGDYQLLSLTTALKHDPSITISLSTPFLKYQLVGSDTTFEKNGTSDLDWMFRRTLPAHIEV